MTANNDSNRGPEFKAPDALSVSKPGMRTLFMTCVGSHMWHMENKESDVDLVVIYIAPTKSILRGEKVSATISQRIEEKNGVIYDTLGWEIGHLIDQLIKGNVNVIWNAASPLVLLPTTTQEDLQALIVDNLCKETYRSILGMAESQIKYEQKPERIVGKGYRTALRTIISELSFSPMVSSALSLLCIFQRRKRLRRRCASLRKPTRPVLCPICPTRMYSENFS